MSGIPARDMIGKGDYEYSIPFYGVRRPQLMDLVWKDDPSILQNYPHVSRDGESLIAEAFCGALNGGRGAHVLAKVSPLHDPNGQVVGAIESIRDITARKQSEAALRASEEQFKGMVETIPLAIHLTTGIEQVTQYVNPTMVKLFGYTQADIPTVAQWWPLAYPDETYRQQVAEEWTARVKHALATQSPIEPMEVVVTCKDGSKKNISWGYITLGDKNYSCGLDLTERKRAEDTANREQALSKAIIDSIPGAFYVLDENGRYARWNSYQCDEIIGQPEALVAGMDAGDTIHPDDRPLIQSRIANVLGRGLDEIVEGRVLLRGGPAFRWLLMTGRQMIIEGRPFLVGIGIDITERKQVEEALQESHRRLELALQGGQLGIWDWEPQAGAVTYSDLWVNMLEYSPDEIKPSVEFFNEHIHPEDMLAVLDRLHGHLEGRTAIYESEHRLRTKSGRWLWVLDRGKVVQRDKDGRPVRVTGIISDIGVRKQAEIERERLTTAIQKAAETVLVSDAQGCIVYVNPSFEALTGYTRAEVLGRNPRILKSGVHDEAFYRTLWGTISSGKTWHGRLVNRKKDGTLFTEEATISPVRDAAGIITSYVGVKRDISRDLALEAQLLQSQKMDSIGRLAGGVAHDFNNILSVILGCAQFVLEDLPESNPLRLDILEIEKAGRRAASLTRQLLAFSRKQVLRPVPLDLNSVLVEMKKMLQRLIGEDIDLVQLLSPNLGQVKADPGQIEQVIMNLAVNARDAMPQGGKLTIETSNVELDEEYIAQHPGAAPGPHATISVSDSGVGMDAKTMARLFEPFFTTKALGKGTGLGLATVYGIVKQSGGSIYVSSEQGVGTTFKVHLPQKSSPTPVVDAPLAVVRSGGTETVLVVEDDEAVRNVAKRILEGGGYVVLTAANGREALLACERYQAEIHLVLTDVVMPEMGGRVFVDHLAQFRRGFKVLYMSGYTDNAIVHHGILDRGTHLVCKPLTRVELLRTVRDVLDGP
jgi:PAS domain S-box-containing protein